MGEITDDDPVAAVVSEKQHIDPVTVEAMVEDARAETPVATATAADAGSSAAATASTTNSNSLQLPLPATTTNGTSGGGVGSDPADDSSDNSTAVVAAKKKRESASSTTADSIELISSNEKSTAAEKPRAQQSDQQHPAATSSINTTANNVSTITVTTTNSSTSTTASSSTTNQPVNKQVTKLKGLLKKSWSECGTEATDCLLPADKGRAVRKRVTFSETMMVFCDDWPIELQGSIVALKSPGEFNLVEVATQGYMFEPPAEYMPLFEPPPDFTDVVAADAALSSGGGNGFAYIDDDGGDGRPDKTANEMLWESMILNDKEMIEEDAIIGLLKDAELLQTIGSNVDPTIFQPPLNEHPEDFPIHYTSNSIGGPTVHRAADNNHAGSGFAAETNGHSQATATVATMTSVGIQNGGGGAMSDSSSFAELDSDFPSTSPTGSLQDLASDSSFASQDTIIAMTNALINGSNKALGLVNGADLLMLDDSDADGSVDTLLEEVSTGSGQTIGLHGPPPMNGGGGVQANPTASEKTIAQCLPQSLVAIQSGPGSLLLEAQSSTSTDTASLSSLSSAGSITQHHQIRQQLLAKHPPQGNPQTKSNLGDNNNSSSTSSLASSSTGSSFDQQQQQHRAKPPIAPRPLEITQQLNISNNNGAMPPEDNRPAPPVRSSVPTSMSVSEIRKTFERSLLTNGNSITASSPSAQTATTQSSQQSQRPRSFPSSAAANKELLAKGANAEAMLATLSVQDQLRWYAAQQQQQQQQSHMARSSPLPPPPPASLGLHPSGTAAQHHQQNQQHPLSNGTAQSQSAAAGKNWPSGEDQLIQYTTEPRALQPSKRSSSVSNCAQQQQQQPSPQNFHQATANPVNLLTGNGTALVVSAAEAGQQSAQSTMQRVHAQPMYLSLDRRDPTQQQLLQIFNANQLQQLQQHQQALAAATAASSPQAQPPVPPRQVQLPPFVARVATAQNGQRLVHLSPVPSPNAAVGQTVGGPQPPTGGVQVLHKTQSPQAGGPQPVTAAQAQAIQQQQRLQIMQQQQLQQQLLVQQQLGQGSSPKQVHHQQIRPTLILQPNGLPLTTSCGPGCIQLQNRPAAAAALMAGHRLHFIRQVTPGTPAQQQQPPGQPQQQQIHQIQSGATAAAAGPQSPRHVVAHHHHHQHAVAVMNALHHQQRAQQFPDPSEIRRRDGLNAFPHVYTDVPKPGSLPVPPALHGQHQQQQQDQQQQKDELEQFVQQDSDRIERIKKRYSGLNDQESQDQDDPTFGFGKRPQVRVIKEPVPQPPQQQKSGQTVQQQQQQQQPQPHTHHVLQPVGCTVATPGQQRKSHVYLIQGGNGPQYQQRLLQVGATLPRHSHLHIIQNPAGGPPVVHQHLHLKPQAQANGGTATAGSQAHSPQVQQQQQQAKGLTVNATAHPSGNNERPASALGDHQAKQQPQQILCYQHHGQLGQVVVPAGQHLLTTAGPAGQPCPAGSPIPGGSIGGPNTANASQLTYKSFSMGNVAMIKPLSALTIAVPIHPTKDERGVPEGASASPKHCSSDSSYGSSQQAKLASAASSSSSSSAKGPQVVLNNNPDLVKDITARASSSKQQHCKECNAGSGGGCSKDDQHGRSGGGQHQHHHQHQQGPGSSQTLPSKAQQKALKAEKKEKEKNDKKLEKEKKKREKEQAKQASKENSSKQAQQQPGQNKEGVIFYSMNV